MKSDLVVCECNKMRRMPEGRRATENEGGMRRGMRDIELEEE